MINLTKQIHLRNMLSCLTDIENCCTDTNERQLEDKELMGFLKINFIILGMEAFNSAIRHPVIETLKSFMCMDFDRDMGEDRYALYNFIVNDLESIKRTIMGMQDSVRNKSSEYALSGGM